MEQLIKQYEALEWASSYLEKYGREVNVAEILLQHHLGVSRATFFMQMRDPLENETWQEFQADIMKHAETGVPVQHLTKTASFYGRDFFVSGQVLVPRFETEELVVAAIHYMQKTNGRSDVTVLDVGTGSGVIAITLKLEMQHATVYATDIATGALEVAKKNAINHEADVQFLQGDFLTPCVELGLSPDVIISNPPYIAHEEEEALQDTVKHFDPSLALYAGENGLAAYRRIVQQIKQLSNPNGLMVFFEIGHEQGATVQQVIKDAFPQAEAKVIQDINGKDRIVAANLRTNV